MLFIQYFFLYLLKQKHNNMDRIRIMFWINKAQREKLRQEAKMRSKAENRPVKMVDLFIEFIESL